MPDKRDLKHTAIALPCSEVRAGNKTLTDVSGMGFSCVSVTDTDDGVVILLTEDEIVTVRNYLNDMIKHYNLE